MSASVKKDVLSRFANDHREEFEDLLRKFVEIPTISVDPLHANDIKRGVELTADTIRSFGGVVEVYQADKGNPVIHGVFGTNSGRPSVTVYNLSLIHISEPTRLLSISYAVFCLKKKKKK